MAAEPGLHFDLSAVLIQLSQDELQHFIYLLWNYPVTIGNDTARVQIALGDPEVMAEYLSLFPSDWVQKVTIKICEEIDRRDLSEKVKEELGVEESYKRLLHRRLNHLWEDNFWPGNIENAHIAMQRYKSLVVFCNPKMKELSGDRKLVLHGPSGLGKTTLVKKLVLEWAGGSQAQVFRYVFYLSCRELNHLAPRSFKQLLSRNCHEWQDDMIKVAQGKDILFVVDGFDELRVPSGALIENICSDWETEKPVSILLSSLLKRALVPNASLLVTTQTQALRELLILVDRPQLLEVEGFLEQERKEYFLRYFGDERPALQALEALKCNAALFHMSAAPAVCWIACTSLQSHMENEEDLALVCQTCTDLFLHFLCSRFPSGDRPNDLKTPLEALCLLAAQGLWTKLSVFQGGDLWKLGLKESDLQPFLDRHILQKDEDCRNCYFFVHFSIQQFLAAMFYILNRKEDESGVRPRWDISDVENLFSREERIKNPNLVQAGRFLFGLLNKKRAQELETTFGCETSTEFKQELMQHKENKPCFSMMDLKEVFICLYESQEEEIVKETVAPLQELSLHLKTTMDLMCSSFCVKKCQSLQRLSLKVAKGIFLENTTLESTAQDTGSQNDQRLLPFWTDLCSMFESNMNLISLDIGQSFLSSTPFQILHENLASAPCRLQNVVLKNISPAEAFQTLCLTFRGCETLTHLTLQDNKQDTVLPSLCEVLRHPKCSLQYLRMESYSVTAQQWDHFFLTLQVNQSLTGLDLADSKLMVEDVKKLGETLRHPQCFLQKLSLENCHLTKDCCKELSSTLMANQSLTHLSLAKNGFGDGGVKILCEGLCHPECKLQTLVLWGCSITHTGCKNLSTVLKSNLKLTTLDLGQNYLGFDGLKKLYLALKRPNVPLQTLRLKLDEANTHIQELLEKIKESNPQLTIHNAHFDPKKNLSPRDFIF